MLLRTPPLPYTGRKTRTPPAFFTASRSALMSLCLLGLLLAFSAAHAAPAHPISSTESKATQNLNQYLSRVTSLQANFSQTTQVTSANRQSGSKSLKSSHLNQTFSGLMQVKRPGQFRWETLSPSRQLIISSGTTVWIYDPDLEQVVKQQLDVQVGNTPALLLSGNPASIMRGFRVTQPDPKQAYFVLYPRATDGVFESLGIRFVRLANGQTAPDHMLLKDSLGQQTSINFSNIRINPALGNAVFDFVPPKGTDIIEQ